MPALVTLALAALLAAPSPADDRIAFVGGSIYDGTSDEAARPLGALVVDDGVIVAEIAADDADGLAELSRADDVTRVDCTGRTVLPGLFDLHVHVGSPGGAYHLAGVLQPDEQLRSALYCGVTTVVDLHSPTSVFALRDRSRVDPSLARLYAAGLAFTRTGGHPEQFGFGAMRVDALDDVAPRMAELMAYEPDVVKSVIEHGSWGGLPAMPTLDDELTAELADAVHAAGRKLFTHIFSVDEARTAVVSGADVLAHGVFLGEVDGPLARAMAREGVAYVPTLAVASAGVDTLRGELPYDELLLQGALHPHLAEELASPGSQARMMLTPMTRLDATGANDRALENLMRLDDAGVLIGIGTDAGNPFVPHGPAVAYELARYVKAGMTPARALRAGTLDSARVLGVEDVLGSLEVGKTADVLVVRGDPTADIADVVNVEHVMKDGVLVDREATRVKNVERAKPVEPRVVGEDLDAVISDFENGSLESPWGGTWTAQSDTVAGGNSTASATVEDGVLAIAGELKSGFAMGPFAGASVVWAPSLTNVVDVTRYDALKLRVRGDADIVTVQLQSNRVRDWDQFVAQVKLTDEWTDVVIPFEDFRQTGFGQRMEWTGNDLIGLSIDTRSSPFGGGRMGAYRVEVAGIQLDG